MITIDNIKSKKGVERTHLMRKYHAELTLSRKKGKEELYKMAKEASSYQIKNIRLPWMNVIRRMRKAGSTDTEIVNTLISLGEKQEAQITQGFKKRLEELNNG